MYLTTAFLFTAIQGIFCLQMTEIPDKDCRNEPIMNYYWRDYTGDIPDDAFIGAWTPSEEAIYVGQAYVSPYGPIVVEIRKGQKKVYAPVYGIKRVQSDIKILCGGMRTFYWATTNSTHLDTWFSVYKTVPVIGGSQNNSPLYIGRTVYEGEMRIGKIRQEHRKPKMFFSYNNKQKNVTNYEILVQ